MNRYMTDKGIQASTVTTGVLAVLTAVAYSPPMLAVWAVSVAATGWAIWNVRAKQRAV